MSQAGAFVAALKNYNLPDFILVLVAKECKSDLLKRGRIDDRLQSMNDDSLELSKFLLDVQKILQENMHNVDSMHMYQACITNVKS